MTNQESFAEFDQLVRSSKLSGAVRKQAWDIFKSEGMPQAVAYISQQIELIPPPAEPISLKHPVPYQVWGREFIDENSFMQMENAVRLPVAVAGALMPDAHKGYGLPIGGVLATDNAVIPYAVGVDIACRMMLTIYPVEPEILNNVESGDYLNLRRALTENTVFGSGGDGLHDGKIEHPILDEQHWLATDLLKGLRKTAIYQIGTSGTGNHFVEWGVVTIEDEANPLNLKPGHYLGLLSHSGSRGVGYKIADYYSNLAMSLLPGLPESVKHLAWLSLDSDAGQEYWHAMNLAGEFASANHHTIHRRVAYAAGLTPLVSIENHHNFAWLEKVIVDGVERELVVHRKGATPAGQGVLGIIPGTMADTGYIVSGKGNTASLSSASHGGGRVMSRNQAKKTITAGDHSAYLSSRGVTLIGGGLDEAPQAYKPIQNVIAAQQDLVDVIGKFQPRLVRMATDEVPWKKKPVPGGIVDAEGD